MSHRRSRLEITIDVLKATQNYSKPTRIMYASNLSWQPLKIILDSLVKQGLIAGKREEKRAKDRDLRTKTEYELTPKGVKVLQYFEGFNKVLHEDEANETG